MTWWRRWAGAVVASTLIALCAPPLRAETGPVTGLPMPRFVSIGVEVANLRIGPRGSYEVVAIYRRRGLPLRVIDEFDTWRHVEDHEGTRGWMHQRLLSGRQVVMVLGEPQVLRRRPTTEAGGILVAEPLVLGRLFECEADWCFVEIDGRRGWLDRDGLWGVDP